MYRDTGSGSVTRALQSERSVSIRRRGKGSVVAVIPTYRALTTISRVIDKALAVTDHVVSSTMGVPENCGQFVRAHFADRRVTVLSHEQNRGVGAATKTGIAEALRLGAEFVVKIDADDQMDTSYVPTMLQILLQHAEIDMVKGNRFADPMTLRTMPMLRFVGNAALTLLVKVSSGYWTIVDPTNGFIALRASAVRSWSLDILAERYFFEIDLLCAMGLTRRGIAELEMPAIYAGERSSLVISRIVVEFPLLLAARFFRRMLLNYLVIEINPGSLYGLIGLPLLAFATLFGAHEWLISLSLGVPRPTGTIILALLLFMLGFQLSLQALIYDVQFSARSLKVRSDANAHSRGLTEINTP